MENNKDKILDYVTMQMDEAAEQAFEAAMAEDEDLRILVRLEQLRFKNIHQRVAKQLVVNESNTSQKLKDFWWNKHKWPLLAAASILLVFSVWLIKEHVASDIGKDAALSYFFKINETDLEIIKEEKTTGPVQLIVPKIVHSETKKTKKTIKKEEFHANKLGDSFYINISKIYFDTSLYQIDVPAGSFPTIDSIPRSGQTESEQARAAYEKGDSAFVHQYYRRNPTDELAISLEGGILYKYQQFDEAALVFQKLQSHKGYKVIAEWNELLCYAARYNYRKKDFNGLADRIKGKHHKAALTELLSNIH